MSARVSLIATLVWLTAASWTLADPVTRVGVAPRDGSQRVRLSQSGDRLTGDVGAATAVLDAFAADGDGGRLVGGLAQLGEADRLLALGALGTALSQRYEFPGPGVDHAGSLAAAATWLSGEAGPSAGACAAIHDSLRRVARSSGFRDAVTLQVGADRDLGHVIAAVRTTQGWALLDYGTVTLTTADDFAEVVSMTSAWGDRLIGDVTVSGRTRLARFETAAGAQARAFLGHEGADGLFEGFLGSTPVGRPALGVRAETGWLAVGVDGGAWRVGAGVLGLAADGLAPSGALHAGGRLARTGRGWWVDGQCSAGSFAWRWDDQQQPSALGAASITGGWIGRAGPVSWRVGLAAEWLADLEALPQQLRDDRGDPFWWLLRGGPGLSVSIPLGGDAALTLASVALVERTVVEPRAEAAGWLASWWRTEAGLGGARWRLAVRSTWEPLTWTHAVEAWVALAPRVRATVVLGQAWSRQPALVRGGDSAELRLDWIGRAWRVGVGVSGDRGGETKLAGSVAWRI